jgi:hypothetical protein
MPDGALFKFCDSGWAGYQRGAFRSLTTPQGDTVEVTAYTPSGRVKTIEWSYTTGEGTAVVTTNEWLVLDYLPSGSDGVERIDKISWSTQQDNGPITLLREQRHEYYGAGQSQGNSGDLKTVTLLEPDGSQLSVVETHYMRYYTGQAGGIGFQHGLRYYLSPTAVEQLKQDPQFTSLDAASDSLLAQYADNYFEYGPGQRVAKSVIAAGQWAYGFAVSESQHADGYNNWRTKTSVTAPNALTTVYFCNHLQQEMLTDDNGAVMCCRYNDGTAPDEGSLAAMEVLRADPAAVVGYDENQAGLEVVLRPNTGLIEERTYYDDTGLAPGYLHQRIHKQGMDGTPEVQETFEYTATIINGVTVYVPSN